MIVITLVFVALALFEGYFLQYHRRKKRTYWIVGSLMFTSYLYVMSVYSIKNLPSIDKCITYVFEPIQKMIGF